MRSLIKLIKNIGKIITTVIDFVISFFQDVVYVVQLTGKFLAEIPNYFSWLPGGLLTILIVIFSIVVIYKVLGREG